MSTYWGYEEKKTTTGDAGLPLTGGTMEGDIDMNYQSLKNLPAPTADYDAVSRKIVEGEIKNIPFSPKMVFYLNVSDSVDFFYVRKYSGGGVEWIGEGNNLLVQNDEAKSVGIKKEGTTSFLSTNDGVSRIRGMVLNCPESVYTNFSVFAVVRKSGGLPGSYWETVWSNDNGGWDKFIGYKRGVNVINYGGIDPSGLGVVTVPSGTDLTKKHLLSVHWLIKGSHIRVNGVKIPGGDFVSDMAHIGTPFSSIFAGIKSSTNISLSSEIDIYGIKLVSGYMTDNEIDGVCGEMTSEYSIS